MILHITKQSAQGHWEHGANISSAIRLQREQCHTDSLGASTAREKGSAGPAHRRRDCGTLYDISPVSIHWPPAVRLI